MDESERYRWDFGLFLILLILTLMGDISMILGVYWGVGATHLVRCGEFHRCLELCPNYINMDFDLIICYFDHFIM